MIKKIARYWNTLRFLKPIQFYWRIWLRSYQPAPDTLPPPPKRTNKFKFVDPYRRLPSLINQDQFIFLNKEYLLKYADEWNALERGKLWLYNLHYFDDLNASGANARYKWHIKLIQRWINENPPAEGTGWEPYPTSLRIVNWIKWALLSHELPEQAVHSLAVQTRWLYRRLEYHLLGNHLLANAKALIFVGLYFNDDEAHKWYRKGITILAKELPEQVLFDGGHFERSPMYHQVILEDLLDLINLHCVYAKDYPRQWNKTANKMLGWSQAMRHPDGDIPFFNDAAFGIAAKPTDTDEYASRLGIADNLVANKVNLLCESGYIVVKNDTMHALLDVASIGPSYLPGHAHADTLSFELSLFGRRVFVNSGTSTYDNTPERNRERGTAAHNTVEIDGVNSSDVWGRFRVGCRAYPSKPEVDVSDEKVVVSCSHDGYLSLPGKNIHYRKWQFEKNRMVIEDCITGDFRNAIAYFHLHPDICVDSFSDKEHLQLRLPEGQVIKVNFIGGKLSVNSSSWQPQFGMSIPNTCIMIEVLDKTLHTICSW